MCRYVIHGERDERNCSKKEKFRLKKNICQLQKFGDGTDWLLSAVCRFSVAGNLLRDASHDWISNRDGL